MSKYALLSLGFSVLLSGCTSYVWYHPDRSESQQQADEMQCERAALQMYPRQLVQVQTAPAYVGPDKTTCDTVGGRTQCVTEYGQRRPATFSTRDLNQSDRWRTKKTCMQALGYAWIEKN